MSEQELQAKIRDLKVTIFDMNEELGRRTQFESQFFTALAEQLGIAKEAQHDPNSYLKAIVELKEKVSAVDAEGEDKAE